MAKFMNNVSMTDLCSMSGGIKNWQQINMFQFYQNDVGELVMSEVDNHDLRDEGMMALSERLIIMAFDEREAMEIFRRLSSGKFALRSED